MTKCRVAGQAQQPANALTAGPGAALIQKCYTRRVPTSRSRYTITESTEVASAIQEAAREWPEDSGAPSRLLLHLIEEGRKALQQRHDELVAADLAVVDRVAGALTGSYPDGYLRELREDWPE